MVRDNFSTLLEAILKDQLGCMTLMPQKWDGRDGEEAPFHIRHWIDDIHSGVQLQRFNRKLLRHAVIDRAEFRDWCERSSIPLPEFWFPTGWTDYRYPGEDEEEARPDTVPPDPAPTDSVVGAPGDSIPEPAKDATPPAMGDPVPATDAPGMVNEKEPRPSQKARIACQVIAVNIWKVEPDKTISSMCRDERLNLGDAAFYDEITVKRWVQKVAPNHVSAKRGRPRKNNPPESE
jgi:hypothetical protein